MASQPGRAGYEIVSIRSGTLRLAGRLYLANRQGAPSPGVVICHGLGSRKENHDDFARVLQARGFAVLTFDLRGHGESDGELDDGVVQDLVEAVRFLASRDDVDSERVGVRGSSLGGMLAVHAAAATSLIKAVVALCPAHESLRRELEGGPEYEAGLQRLAATIRLDRQGFHRFLAERDVVSVVGRLAPRPLLLVHCRGDEVVPYHLSEGLYEAAGSPRELWPIEGGSHGYAQHEPELQQRIAEWLEARLSEAEVPGNPT